MGTLVVSLALAYSVDIYSHESPSSFHHSVQVVFIFFCEYVMMELRSQFTNRTLLTCSMYYFFKY